MLNIKTLITETKEPIIVFNDYHLKYIHDQMMNIYGKSSIKILKPHFLYKDTFNKWYHEGLKYIIIKMKHNKIYKLEAYMKSLIHDTQVWIHENKCIEVLPQLSFIIITKEPLLMNLSLRYRTKEFY